MFIPYIPSHQVRVIKSYESSHRIFSLKILHSYFEVYKCACYKFVYNKLDMIINKIKGKNILHTQYYNTTSDPAKLIEAKIWCSHLIGGKSVIYRVGRDFRA